MHHEPQLTVSCAVLSVDNPSETVLVRTCSADSDTLTMDTEISRVPKACGVFDFADNATSWDQRPNTLNNDGIPLRRLRGCINACSNLDGCNGGNQLMSGPVTSLDQLLLLMQLLGFCNFL